MIGDCLQTNDNERHLQTDHLIIYLRRSKMKKFYGLLTMVMLISVLSLSGCGNANVSEDDLSKANSNESSTAENVTTIAEPIEIGYQIAWDVNSGRGVNIQSIVDVFNESNPDIKVSLITGSSDDKQIITSLLNDETPEVIQLSAKSTKTIAAEGLLKDFLDNEASYKEIFYPELVDFFKYEDELYAAPWIGHTIELVYNKNLFEQAGLDPETPPKTWADVMTYSKVIEEKTGVTGLGMSGMQHNDTIWMSTPIILSSGGKWIDYVDGKEVIAINTPEGIEGLKMYQDFAKAYEGAAEKNGGNIMEDFRNGKIAMEFQGPWGVTDIWKNGNPFDVSTGLMPSGPSGRFADGGPYGMAIPVSLEGEKLDAALEFIEFMQTKAAQEKIMEGEYDEATDAYYPYRTPMRKDMADSEFFVSHPEFEVFIEGLADVIDSFPTPGFNQVSTEVITVELNKLASGSTTPEAAAAKIESDGNAVLRNFYGD